MVAALRQWSVTVRNLNTKIAERTRTLFDAGYPLDEATEIAKSTAQERPVMPDLPPLVIATAAEACAICLWVGLFLAYWVALP